MGISQAGGDDADKRRNSGTLPRIYGRRLDPGDFRIPDFVFCTSIDSERQNVDPS
jgi:hypothetical protein